MHIITLISFANTSVINSQGSFFMIEQRYLTIIQLCSKINLSLYLITCIPAFSFTPLLYAVYIQGPPNLWQHNFILKRIYLISCYNCCCRYISSLNTSILDFRSLNYINNIISIAIDRETIVSLHKKSESNSTIAKELQIRRKTVWKVVKKFRETGQTSNDQARAEREQFEPREWLKAQGKS